MEPVESKSKKHFIISIFKSLFRLGACYGIWMWGTGAGEPVMQAVGILLGIAEILGIAEEV
tara:strand:+ start:1754 stop:1936 length:183 start_codon:yes stop_codon:yes gene_type:complete